MVSGELKLSVYSASTVMVVPTSQENFGLVFPEAMACGTPVITTRGVDIWKELERGGATIVEATSHAVADAIDFAIADPKRSADTGRRGRDWVLENLAEDRVAAGYEAMYAQVIAGN
jgi:glycosyltransferase involved in cell wall biosynthesis